MKYKNYIKLLVNLSSFSNTPIIEITKSMFELIKFLVNIVKLLVVFLFL